MPPREGYTTACESSLLECRDERAEATDALRQRGNRQVKAGQSEEPTDLPPSEQKIGRCTLG